MKKILIALMIFAFIPCFAYAGFQEAAQAQGMKWTSISTATTTVIKSTFCFLGDIIVTGGSSGTIQIWANSLASGPLVTNFSATNSPQVYPFNINLASGCTVVTSAATTLVVTWL